MSIKLNNEIIGSFTWETPQSVQSFLEYCEKLEKHPQMNGVSKEIEEEIKKWIETLLTSISYAYLDQGKTEAIYHIINNNMKELIVLVRLALENPSSNNQNN